MCNSTIYSLALLLPLITGTFGCETRDGITKKIKTGYVDITKKGNRLILNIRKFGKSNVKTFNISLKSRNAFSLLCCPSLAQEKCKLVYQ